MFLLPLDLWFRDTDHSTFRSIQKFQFLAIFDMKEENFYYRAMRHSKWDIKIHMSVNFYADRLRIRPDIGVDTYIYIYIYRVTGKTWANA